MSRREVSAFKVKSKETNNPAHVGKQFRNGNNNYNKHEKRMGRGSLTVLKRIVTIARQLKMEHLISHPMLHPSKKMRINTINESNGDNSR